MNSRHSVTFRIHACKMERSGFIRNNFSVCKIMIPFPPGKREKSPKENTTLLLVQGNTKHRLYSVCSYTIISIREYNFNVWLCMIMMMAYCYYDYDIVYLCLFVMTKGGVFYVLFMNDMPSELI